MTGRLAPAAALLAVAFVAGCGGSAPRPPIALLTGVDVGAARVEFRFRSAPRGATARFVRRSELIEDGSGRRVRVAGTAWIVVRFEPASGWDASVDDGEATYVGPRRIRGTGAVREAARLGDFEAVLTWAVGLDRRRGYTLERHGDDVALALR